MRKFNLMEEYNSIISNSNIINLISKIHEYKGKQSYLLDAKKDTLETLLKVAKIQSTSSSNKIEGIYTTDKRINEIVNQKLEPKNRNEEEIAGYRDVLSLIHENYNFIDINKNTNIFDLVNEINVISNLEVLFDNKIHSIDEFNTIINQDVIVNVELLNKIKEIIK